MVRSVYLHNHDKILGEGEHKMNNIESGGNITNNNTFLSFTEKLI